MKINNPLTLFLTKLKLYRAKNAKAPKEFTFFGWIHNAIQVLAAGMGAEICASRVVSIEQTPFVVNPDPLTNPWYWYFSFGFVATLLISFFGLWDMFIFGRKMMENVLLEGDCDGNLM